jgi:glutaredoxin
MEGCPHCDEVLATTLPALEQKYGSLLNIQKIELISVEDVDQLYQLGEAFGLKRENIKVPFVVMGDKALVGKADINKNLPLLMQSALEENQASLNAADSPAPAFSASPLNFMIPVIAAGLTLVGLIVNRVRKKRETNNLEE